MRINNILLAVSLLALTSCSVYRPFADRVGSPDYNGRVYVEGPKYSVRPNAVGVAVTAGLPVAGAAAGAMLGPVKKQTAEGRSTSTVGSAVFGALVGSGFSYLSTLIGGYGKNAAVKDAKQWARRAGDDFIVLSYGESAGDVSRIILIDRDSENHYEVRNLDDVRDFAAAFPGSMNSDYVFEAALAALPRGDMPALMEIMPHAVGVSKAVDRYINESPTFDELTKALAKYPSGRDVEKLYARLVRNAGDALKFNGMYPNSSFKREVVAMAFNSADNSIDDIKKLRSAFGSSFELTKDDMVKVPDDIRQHYFLAQSKLLAKKDKKSLDSFNQKYSWLGYSGKNKDVMGMWWDMSVASQKKGENVIRDMGALAKKPYAGAVGITGQAIKDFSDEKFREIINDKVQIVKTESIFSGSDEFEEWLKSPYTAGIVQEEEGFKMLLYGELKNNSIFDLPVMVNMSGSIYVLQHMEATGVVGGLLGGLKALFEGLGGKITVDERLNNRKIPVGSISTSSGFSIPCLKAGETAPYAILIDLSSMRIGDETTNKKGVNFADIMKATQEVKLEDISIRKSLDSSKITKDRLKTQSEWLALARNGMPSSGVFDVYRNEKLRQREWDAEWERILSTPVPASSSSSSSSSEIESKGKMNVCKIRLFWSKDGDLVTNEKISAGYDGGIFEGDYHYEFETDDDGYAVLTWPDSETEYLNYVCVGFSMFEHYSYILENLHLEDGGFYSLDISTLGK